MARFAYLIFMLSVATLGPSPTFAMDYSNFRRSDNIEDRRGEGAISDIEHEAKKAKDLLERLAAQADSNGFPFHCSAFKQSRTAFSDIGKKLRGTKYVNEIFNRDESSIPSLKAAGQTTGIACLGSRDSALSLVDNSKAEVQKDLDYLNEKYGALQKGFPSLYEHINTTEPALLDRLNKDCPKAKQMALDAIKYLNHSIVEATRKGQTLISELNTQRTSILNMRCSTATEKNSNPKPKSASTIRK